MTIFLPLEPAKTLPSSPPFLVASSDPRTQTAKVVKAILKAKRVVIICGAGISVKAGIPDFRSPDGLFQTLKRDNPREQLSSGRDLFDASVFNSEQTTSLFFQMIARLSSLSMTADPTPFHYLLHSLDDRGRLLRVYTQNIDAIERKAGLSFGVPESSPKPRSKSKSSIGPSSASAVTQSASRLPSPPLEIPRCIPLHGTLQTVHCQTCTHKYPLEEYLPSLESGLPPQCPECTSMEETRQVIGKRARGIGRLRPSVVLYNEMHQDGEGVGDVVEKDLMGSSKGKGRSGADLLLVVGTSLRVPGTKRMVREFAKAVHARGGASPKESSTSSPSSSPRRSPTNDEDPPFRSIYLNMDFPVPTREWDGVFDVWLQGDAQIFAEMMEAEIKKEAEAKQQALDRKRKREEEAAAAADREFNAVADCSMKQTQTQTLTPPKSAKRKHAQDAKLDVSPKRRIVVTSGSKRSHSSSSRESQCEGESPGSGIILRIPPRTRLIPEVVITTLPPNVKRQKAPRAPPSPPQTPPRTGRGKSATPSSKSKDVRTYPLGKPNSRRKDTKQQQPSPRAPVAPHPPREPAVPLPTHPTHNASQMTDSMVRTMQYGLRGSALS
ncbi:hypothetical protein PC9H_009539 [Pleurotus ostreatus]|uniref:Deacetylase sirtuin-type domain-containing protein n=2 Tax=Pleurotus TaxID=5320 RepID=A0A8H6ZM10_PLEOS|nr:uncharacterized protein PC9H_009539 [Pleurotus ostreatus]KAF7424233.1 hypothetical protein PC9H_009539 [Pleurotus ostreatus]KAG9224691.1 hypothetical protein CCMSSC00406_0002158 [Pleurotus cornucopiae]KAJ8692891.1 hypothetical protein PTI98_010159 [Pleurotus ostreatus]